MRFALCFALAPLFACASGGGSRPETAAYSPAEGTFEFSANIPGGAARGTMVVTPDTFYMKQSESCGIMQSSFTEIRVACQGGSVSPSSGQTYQSQTNGVLTFNRRSPGLSASWSMQIPIARQREICFRTEVRNGRETCVERKRETYYVYERHSGSVQVRKVAPSSK
jgi:hypothetical protein